MMINLIKKTGICIFLILIINNTAFSYNQLRLDKFRWQTARTPNLYVYHYNPKKDKFNVTPYVNQLELTHQEITKFLDIEFAKKNPVFIYYDHAHFRQNRLSPVGDGTEGFSELFKNRLNIPVRYSKFDMNHLIAHEYVHIAQFEILYGGFWKSARLIKGLSGMEPLWVMEGMAEAISHRILNRPWSSYDRMILRDGVLYDYLYNLRELQNFSALYTHIYLGYKEGHSAIDYLIEQEGTEVCFNLLKAMRTNFDPIKAFETASKKFASLRDFNTKWQKDLEKRVHTFVENKDDINDISKIEVSDKYNSINPVYYAPEKFLYVSDRWQINEIYIHTPKNELKILPRFFGSNVRRLVTGRRFDRIIDFNSRKSLLVFAAEKKHKYFIFLYNTITKNLKKFKFDLHEIRSPAISDDGNKIVFTALKDGRRSIYIYNIASRRTEKITDDDFIDYSPVFSPDGNSILTATERDLNTDLRLIDITTNQSKWLTETPYNEIHPGYKNQYTIIYSADKSSVYNIFEYDTINSTAAALTNIKGGTFWPAAADDNKILISCYFNSSFKIAELTSINKKIIANTRKYIIEPSTAAVKSSDIKWEKFKPKFSTDFFMPSFLYSTDIGFVGGAYYRASDIVGNHSIDFYGWGWPDMYDIAFQYTLKKYRPDIFLIYNTNGENYLLDENDASSDEVEEINHTGIFGVIYPLNSFLNITQWLTARSKDERNIMTDDKFHEVETGAGISIQRSTALLEPFHITRGSLLSISAYAARPYDDAGLEYSFYNLSLRKYIPFGHRLTWANRFYLAKNEGEDAELLDLGVDTEFNSTPVYGLRGYPTSKFKGHNVASLGSEFRFMVIPRINGHLYFMWPDINIYSLSVNMFSDFGNAWNGEYRDFPRDLEEWGVSYGFGLTLNLYLLQLAPVFVSAEFAKPHDSEE